MIYKEVMKRELIAQDAMVKVKRYGVVTPTTVINGVFAIIAEF
jgi:hypothetical protein